MDCLVFGRQKKRRYVIFMMHPLARIEEERMRPVNTQATHGLTHFPDTPRTPSNRQLLENARKAKEAVERRKGRLDLCSICKGFFRSKSAEVGIFVCPTCRSK